MRNNRSMLAKAAVAVALAVSLTVPAAALADEGDVAGMDMDTQEAIDSVTETDDWEAPSGSVSPFEIRASLLGVDPDHPDENLPIVKMVVPTSISVAVTVNAADLTYKGYRSADSMVENLAASMLPVKVDVVDVVDSAPLGGLPGAKGILEFVDMTLVERVADPDDPSGYVDGSTKVGIPPKEGENRTILALIYPGFKGRFATNVAVKESMKDVEIPVGSYTTEVTMKVRAVFGADEAPVAP